MSAKKKYFTEEERKAAEKIWQERYRRKKGIPSKRKYFTIEEKVEGHRMAGERYRRKKGRKIRIFRTKEETRKLKAKRTREYYKNHKEKMKNYYFNRLKIDINFKLRHYLRSRLYKAIKIQQKSGSAVDDLGCSIPELKIHLEAQFQEGMSWDNWSCTGWHIDHIIPLSSFNLSNREEFLKACHYTNLQPLWAEENFSKNNKI
jgi:hypothetical protein